MTAVDGLNTRLDRRLKSGAVRNKTVGTRMTNAEERELIDAADRNGQNISEWSRDVLLREARGLTRDPVFTEVVAMRMLLNVALRAAACGELMTVDKFNEQMQSIRAEKYKAAGEVLQQYTAREVGR